MTFRPLHNRVLVRRLKSEETTKGGIIIPGTAQEKPMEGIVIACGTGTRDETGKLTPLDVQTGDHVMFQWGATEITIDGEELLVIEEPKIMGVVTGKKGKAKKAA